MSSYILKTLGCKANLFDSQVIEQELQKKGWSPRENWDDSVKLCIINSCTVTDEADRQTRKMATRLARENPQASVVVTGCSAEVHPEEIAQTQGVHFVVGNQDKHELVQLVLDRLHSQTLSSDILKAQASSPHAEILGSVQNYQQLLSRHPHDREWPEVTPSFTSNSTEISALKTGHSAKTRSFLKIQEGCNSFCTYCIIPYGRGPARSLRPKKVIESIQTLIRGGAREVILTGTNLGDYGVDWQNEPALGDLIALILEQTTLERLRVSSLDPTEITPQILSLMKTSSSRFCPHFHVSLQSPHSRILRLMKRKYGFDQVAECLQEIAKIQTAEPGGAFVGMDVITGFPGETEEEFQWGLQALENLPWQRLHVFPYSERAETPATRLPQAVPQSVRVQRARTLNKLSLNRLTSHYRKVLNEIQSAQGSLENVLLERGLGKSGWRAGYTPNYLRVLLPHPSSALEANALISATPLDLMVDSKAGDVALVAQ